VTRPDLAAELDAVTRHLVLLAALVENLARSVRSRQDGLEPKDDAPAAPPAGMPACTCPPCLEERATGRRP
jgi:hypothetical protein